MDHAPTIFDAFPIIQGQQPNDTNLYLIFLNRPFECDRTFKLLWQSSTYRICADGAANRLYDAVMASELSTDKFIPEAIIGDMDSIKPTIRVYYFRSGSNIIEDEDQYSTDFGKSMAHLRFVHEIHAIDVKDISNVVIYGSFSGRVDQGLGLIGELFRETERYKGQLRLWLLSESGLSWILPPGTNIIKGLQELDINKKPIFTPNVGIIPTYGPSCITTKGLEWDVTDWHTHMGGNVSSSNHVVAKEVIIISTEWILFTIERAKAEDT